MIPRSAVNALTFTGLALISGAFGSNPSELTSEADIVPVRIVYTETVFRDVHVNDAKASIKVWSESAAKEMGVDTRPEIEVLPDIVSLAQRFETKCADFGGSTMSEFLQIESRINIDPVFAVIRENAYTVKYLILARRDGDVNDLHDLGGTDLRLHDNPRTSLALPWLDLLLTENGMGSAANCFEQITEIAKLSAVVLPVFFGQADACLVTQDGFLMMSELNPQVERDLLPIVESPEVVPMVSFLRRDYTPSFREELIEAICSLHSSPAGQQILNLMQGDGVVVVPPAALESSRELMLRWGCLWTRSIARNDSSREPHDQVGGGEQ